MLLIDKIRSTLKSGTKVEQKLADYILNHADVIFETITDVINKSQVGYGTVVRYCKKLGCSGFQDFKIRLAFEASLVQDNDFALSNRNKFEMHDYASSISQKYIEQLLTTARNLESGTVDRITRAIIDATRILVVGVAGSLSAAVELVYRFTRLGFNAICESDDHMQAIRASNLDKADVLIVVSFTGSTKSILDAAKIEKKNGATIFAITNFLHSPLIELVDGYLWTALWEQALEAEIGSRIPFFFLIEVITAEICRIYPNALQEVKRTSDSVSGKQL